MYIVKEEEQTRREEGCYKRTKDLNSLTVFWTRSFPSLLTPSQFVWLADALAWLTVAGVVVVVVSSK